MDFNSSMFDLKDTTPASKTYLLQISDPCKLEVPLEEDDEELRVRKGKDASSAKGGCGELSEVAG